MAATTTASIGAAHRLVLSRLDWAVLVRQSPTPLPPDLVPAPPTDADADADTELRSAAVSLIERGVLAADGEDPLDAVPVPPVAANLAVLAAPRGLRVEVGIGQVGVRAAYAVGDPLAASLFTLAEGGVELSLFDATRLGPELLRAVPEPEQWAGGATRVRRALSEAEPEILAGRLPLAALAQAGTGAGPSELESEASRLADAAAEQTVGVLRCLVVGRAADGVAVGQVVWLATDRGWVGLAPDRPESQTPMVSPEPQTPMVPPEPQTPMVPPEPQTPMVRLVPVARADFGTWVAPYIAQLLEAGDG